MAEPDDLYTLRAQFWLGHYDMVRPFVSCGVGGVGMVVSEPFGRR